MTRRIAKLDVSGRVCAAGCSWHPDDPNAVIACPYGVIGDNMWVREAWRTMKEWDDLCPSKLPIANVAAFDDFYLHYCANGAANARYGRYRHARFMPYWASRILLEIQEVRLERLNDISEEDALAEGVTLRGTTRYEHECKDAFRELWESINGEGSWNLNPYVWAIRFVRIP